MHYLDLVRILVLDIQECTCELLCCLILNVLISAIHRRSCAVKKHLCGKPCKFTGRPGCLEKCTMVSRLVL
jgi:hypothetical protein